MPLSPPLFKYALQRLQTFFFLEHAGELRINILRRKKGKAPR